MPRSPLPILWRTLLATASVLGIAFLLLALSPVTISAPIRLPELAVLTAGAAVLFALNWLLVRHALMPLRMLSEQMERTDLRSNRFEIPPQGAQAPEIEVVSRAYSRMVARLAQERRETSRVALAAQEGERLRISRELHDEIGQSLIALALQAERAAASTESPEAEAQFKGIAEQIHFNLDELRRIAHELRPELLDDLGLTNALVGLANGIEGEGGRLVTHEISPALPALSGEHELVIYRVAQEALSNAARHSGAERLQLLLCPSGSELQLTVTDDGTGISTDARDGTGLQGMRERALLVGGRLDVGPGPGDTGTRVQLIMPIDGEQR